MKARTALNHMRSWSARGSKCPICRKDFRSDACPHNVVQAKDRLFENYIKAVAAEGKK